jgi:hypothetical protein
MKLTLRELEDIIRRAPDPNKRGPDHWRMPVRELVKALAPHDDEGPAVMQMRVVTLDKLRFTSDAGDRWYEWTIDLKE